jgi:hypothetical protein
VRIVATALQHTELSELSEPSEPSENSDISECSEGSETFNLKKLLNEPQAPYYFNQYEKNIFISLASCGSCCNGANK